MKIVFLNIYQNKVERGAETFVTELSNRLSKNSRVDVISQDRALPERIPVLWRLFLDPQGLEIFWFTFKNIPKIWKEKYDIIITLNGGWQPAIIRIVTWLYGGHLIISGQSGIGWDDRNNLWCFPDAFVALSSKELSWAKKVMPIVKSYYIPNGVDLNKFKINATLRDKNLKLKIAATEKKTVLTVGAATKQKRLDLVIDATAKLEGVNLLIASGGGDMKQEIMDYGLKVLGRDRFEMISVQYDKMPDVYRRADVFTLPSTSSEAFGNVFVEAMASGLPVVATDDSIRCEMVGDAGIFVDPENTDEYAKSLETALKTKWENKPRIQAEKFSWDEIAIKYEELFKTLNK